MGKTTCFFSFGPEESYISQSHEGLKYRNLPPALQELIHSGNILEVHWAALGPLQESWVLSFKDTSKKNKIEWGTETPSHLQELLTDANPTPHLYIFLGHRDSFIAWSPDFIRWVGLPFGLEACLQAWLTPSGWKAGPPRIVTWGRKGTYFALSEYGEVEWHFRNDDVWGVFKETVEEWDAEEGYEWGDLAYITLDPTTPGQFVAIREDRMWAGSIDESNEDALEAFASNFFENQSSESQSKPQTKSNQQSNGTPQPTDTIPNARDQALYKKWEADVASRFASAMAALHKERVKSPKKLEIRSKSSTASIPTVFDADTRGKLLTEFPYIPAELAVCSLEACVATKSDPDGLRACEHDVERLFRASGLYSYEWLRQERIRWHPDRFGRLCEDEFRETGSRLAEEMFKIVDGLMTKLESTGADGVA